MAPPLNSQDDRAAFVDACIDKRKKAMDAWESLGLISLKSNIQHHGEFLKDKANELQDMVERIAKSFAMSYRGTLEELHSYLRNEDVFSDDILGLGREYGAKIWGRLEDGEIRLSGESQGKGIEEHDWDDSRDRTNILFYIRCWITSIVVREYKPPPRKGKGKGRVRESGPSEDQHNQDTAECFADSNSPDTPGFPFRAPEPPRMYSMLDPRNEATSLNASEKTPSTSFNSANNSTTPSKRKAQGVHERTPSGKLSKPSKGARPVPVLAQQQRDPYSIPVSPPPLANLGRLSFGRRRETTYDTDATWMPRGATADTETVVGGEEEVLPGEVDSCLQNAIAMVHEDEMQYQYEDEAAAGPSGTYRNPLRQDSVIPNDTQPQNDDDELYRPPTPNPDTPSDAYNEAIIQSLISNTSPMNKQTRSYRTELFKLLICYLNSIDVFSPTTYDSGAEERMNFLINNFLCNDTEIWNANHTDSAIRLQLTLERWMGMRHRLAAFRSATGYFGPPGQRWEEFLRGLDDVPNARAMLAYVELRDEGEGEGAMGSSFDEDLMVVFDGLTRVKRCTGPEAFKRVRKFNEKLLEWFVDE